jgi:uncharacterized protein YecE (DUF72 family)
MKPALAQTGLTFVFFNNHWRGYAPRNATDIKKELRLPVQELPLARKLLDEE